MYVTCVCVCVSIQVHWVRSVFLHIIHGHKEVRRMSTGHIMMMSDDGDNPLLL